MFSSPAEPPAGAGNALPSSRSWSLTIRIALLTALSSFVILAVVSIQMYLMLATHLDEQNYLFLKDEAEALSEMARFPDFVEALAKEARIEHAGEEYLSHYLRLVQLDGTDVTIVATPGMEQLLPRTVFPSPLKALQHDGLVRVHTRNNASFILTSLLIDPGAGREKPLALQVALDVTNVEKVLGRYRVRLVVTLLIGMLLCAATGLAIARRGVRPIRDITERAREITVANLDERLCGADWPRELNALAGALNGMLDRLQKSFSSLYNSVANLTHKLRTPLTILRGEAEVALARERSPEELREVIESSVEEYGRLSHLVDNIIFIAQAEAGKLQHVAIKMKARAEIDKVLDYYGPLADEKGVPVTCEGDLALAADPTLFRKAITNLLSNALTYTESGGTVHISVGQGDAGFVEVRVTDSGCGIDEQEMPKILDRFYRVYTTRFMDPLASGLGLSLVKTIMDLHNGTIEIQSQPGRGTTVILRFPPPII